MQLRKSCRQFAASSRSLFIFFFDQKCASNREEIKINNKLGIAKNRDDSQQVLIWPTRTLKSVCRREYSRDRLKDIDEKKNKPLRRVFTKLAKKSKTNSAILEFGTWLWVFYSAKYDKIWEKFESQRKKIFRQQIFLFFRPRFGFWVSLSIFFLWNDTSGWVSKAEHMA